MKRKVIPILCLIALCACQGKREAEAPQAPDVFHALLDNQETKVYMDEGFHVYWNANDAVSVFAGTTENREFHFSGADGDKEGDLVAAGQAGSGNALGANYAAFPYRRENSIASDGTIGITLPSAQEYCEGTFDPAAQLMVARSSGKSFTFKNVMCLFGFPLTGSGVQVKSLTLTGNSGETLSGDIKVVAGDNPGYSFTGSGKTLTLTAAAPVALSADTPKYFWFVFPPMTLADGFTLKVTDDSGQSFEKAVHRELTLIRNKAHTMDPLEVSFESVPSDLGIYHGTNTYTFDASSEQISIYEAEGQMWVRYLAPSTLKMYEVGPIPADAAAGQSFQTMLTEKQAGETLNSERLKMSVVSLENEVLVLKSGSSYFVLKF